MFKLAEKLAKKYNIATKLVSEQSHQYVENVVNYLFDDKFEQQIKSQLAIQFVFPSLMEIYSSDKDNLKRKYISFSSTFENEKKRDKFINFDIDDSYLLATRMVKLLTVKELHEESEPSQLLTVSIIFSPNEDSIRGEATHEMTNDIYLPSSFVKNMVRGVVPYLSYIEKLLNNGKQSDAEQVVIKVISRSNEWDKFFNIIKYHVLQHEIMHTHTMPHLKPLPYESELPDIERGSEKGTDDLRNLHDSLYFHSKVEQPSMKNDFLIYLEDKNIQEAIQGMDSTQALEYIKQNVLSPYATLMNASFDLNYIRGLYEKLLSEGNEKQIKYLEKRWGYRNTNDVFNTIDKNIKKFYLYILGADE